MAAKKDTRAAYGPSATDLLSNANERNIGTGGGGRFTDAGYGPGRMEGLGVGRTGGFAGPTFRGDNFKVSAGVGRRGSVGVGGKVRFKKGGSVSSASKRADGIATKGKTKGKMV